MNKKISDRVKKGDILVFNNGTKGHTEIYVGQKQSSGWGSVKTKLPNDWATGFVKNDGKVSLTYTYTENGVQKTNTWNFDTILRFKGRVN